jgi:hypothetical protein
MLPKAQREQRLELIIELHNSQCTRKQILEAVEDNFGKITAQTLNNLLAIPLVDGRCQRRHAGRAGYSKYQVHEALKQYCYGTKVWQIAHATGIPSETIRRIVTQNKLRRGSIPPELKDEILNSNGSTIKE